MYAILPSARFSMRMYSYDSVLPFITVWPRPSIMPAAGAVHCSVNSRWLTLPAQHPCSQSSAASGSRGRRCVSMAALRRRRRRRRHDGRRGVTGGRARASSRRERCGCAGAGTCASATDDAHSAASNARVQTQARGARGRRTGLNGEQAWAISGSLRPRERQVEEEVLRLQHQAVAGVHRHREVDRSARDRRPHVGRVGESSWNRHSRRAIRASSTSALIVQVVQQRARLGVEARRATPSARRRSRAAARSSRRRRGNARSSARARASAPPAPGGRG